MSGYELQFSVGEVQLKDEVHCYFVGLPPLPDETGTQYNNRAYAWLMSKPQQQPSFWRRLKMIFS